jgi:hypothetical protein
MREMSDYENGNGSIKLFFCCRGKMEQDKSVQPCNPTDIYNFLDVDLVTAKDDAAYRTVKGSWATLLPDPTECVRVSVCAFVNAQVDDVDTATGRSIQRQDRQGDPSHTHEQCKFHSHRPRWYISACPV